MPMAFYLPVAEDRFESAEYTRGPWDAGAQHAGPPAALLGRAIERAVEAKARPGMRVARLTYDIARPVPMRATRRIGCLLYFGLDAITAGIARIRRPVLSVPPCAVDRFVLCVAGGHVVR
jgi:hypothetical protein